MPLKRSCRAVFSAAEAGRDLTVYQQGSRRRRGQAMPSSHGVAARPTAGPTQRTSRRRPFHWQSPGVPLSTRPPKSQPLQLDNDNKTPIRRPCLPGRDQSSEPAQRPAQRAQRPRLSDKRRTLRAVPKVSGLCDCATACLRHRCMPGTARAAWRLPLFALCFEEFWAKKALPASAWTPANGFTSRRRHGNRDVHAIRHTGLTMSHVLVLNWL